MSQSYLRELAAKVGLSPNEWAVLTAVNVSTHEELVSLLWSFPGLIDRTGLDAARLSNAVAQDSIDFMAVMGAEGLDPDEPQQYAFGAEHAPGAPWRPGTAVELPEQPAQ